MKRYIFLENEASLPILQNETADKLYSINNFGKVSTIENGEIVHVTRQQFKQAFDFTDDMLMQVIRSRGKIAFAEASKDSGPISGAVANAVAEVGEVRESIPVETIVSESKPIHLGKSVTEVVEANVQVTEDTMEAAVQSNSQVIQQNAKTGQSERGVITSDKLSDDVSAKATSTAVGNTAANTIILTDKQIEQLEAGKAKLQEAKKVPEETGTNFKTTVREFMKKPFMVKDEVIAEIDKAITAKQYLTEDQVRDIIRAELFEFLKVLKSGK